MGKEEFIKKGYVFFGYISPELSTENTYPEYIKKNVDEVIEKLKEIPSKSRLSFAFMTDLHYSATTNHDIRTYRLMNAYKQIKNKTDLNMLVLGGDYVNDGTKTYKINNYRSLRRFIENENYFPVNGNHDDNSIWDLCIQSPKSIHHLTNEELYDEFYNHLPEKNANFHKVGCEFYYFWDDKKAKIRYIYIDSNDIPYFISESGKLKYTKQHLFALSQQQIDWICNKALKFDEEGWDIIFVSHAFPRWDANGQQLHNEKMKLEPLGDIIDYYQKGENLRKVYFEGDFRNVVDADFSSYNRGNIIACFAGHYHDDFEEFTKEGIPVIYTGNVMMYKYEIPRIDGDKSELLFDIVTIDRENRFIYTTRVGAGKDRKISY